MRNTVIKGARGAAGALALLALLACNEPPRDTPGPLPSQAPAPLPPEVMGAPSSGAAASTSGAAASTSVPDAASVLGTTGQARQEPTAVRNNKSMSRTEESTAMPLPGQNNDHSAPLPPAKRASSP